MYLLHGGTRRIVRYEQIKFTCYILLFPPIRRKREFSLTRDHNNPHVTDLFPPLHSQTRAYLTPTYLRASLGRHLQSGVVSENWLIASKNAIDDAFHLVRDEYHKDRTKVKVVELY